MRNVAREIELKLALTPADFAALKAHPTFAELLESPVSHETLTSVYFDTDQRDLRDHGVTLRVRRSGDKFIQTIKSVSPSGSVLERGEWEHELEGGQPDLDAAAGTALESVLTAHVRATLRPVFETRVRRTYYHLADSAWQIEFAYDQGEIVAGNRTLPICEIELELKFGYRAALFELARMIVEVIPAQVTLEAKSDRAYQLAEDKPQQSVHAEDMELVPGMTAEQSFQVVALGCLRQLTSNVALVHRRNPEALHQIRIALRRLRTAISLFAEIVRDGQIDRIKTELKWLGKELSPARDQDTLHDEVLLPLRQEHPDHRGLRSLSFTFARQRLQSYKRAENAVLSLRFCRLLVETLAWVEIGEWATTTDELAQLRRDWPIESYASEQLSRRCKKIRKKGKQLEKLDPERRHMLRIQVKKARYATEFFASLFHDKKSAKRSTRILSSLKRLQSSLGGLNDVKTREVLCADTLVQQSRANGADGRDRAFAAGLVTGNQEARRDQLLADAVKAYAQFEDIKPFWK
ncbi:MAG TPA: CHAD domain-containing protein [Xanthobacteraceae bacterium]|nr:CHAD domain-containing protein [Xanthobacteraceae bacterium]